jgi:hypothetical protein
MKIWTGILLVSAYPGMACAQSTEHTHEIVVSASQAQHAFPTGLGNVWYDEFEKIKGTYYFANGKNMNLSMWGNRMYAEIDGKNRFALVAISPHVFFSRNQQVRITIEDPDESVGDITASVVLPASFLPDLAYKDELIKLFARR